MKKIYALFFLFVFACLGANAQRLTGKWRGIMSDEILEINFLDRDGVICGFSYDFMINNPRSSYCKALFTMNYDNNNDVYYLNGTSFLENHGGHVLMRMKIWFEKRNGERVMMALVGIKSGILSMFSPPDMVELRRIAARPDKQKVIEDACFPQVKPELPKTNPAPPKPKPQPAKPKVDSQVIFSPPPPAVKKDSIVKIIPKPVPKVEQRVNKEFAHLVVSDKKFTMKVYDNGVIDGDTVSIYYNGKLLVDKKRISEEPIIIELELDEKATQHKITMFAENLGSIPPNTALIVITTSDKRFELHSSASLTENAVLMLDYKPK
ncbi:MAG: hypothetical protein ABIT96_01275 [Ferruginibacter sp.]